ncbi:MAG: hypothetical protein QW445_07545 [Candidatus Bathyarchaeia archaeon]
MKIATHKAFVYAAARVAGVDDYLTEYILRGVVAPDVYPEEELTARLSRSGNIYFTRRRVRHHTIMNRARIMKLIWRARKLYLKGKREEAAYWLGFALHYVHDMCISKDAHATVEAAMRQTPIPTQTIRDAVERAPRSPSFLHEIIDNLGPAAVNTAMANAAVATGSIVAAVFTDKEAPAIIEAEYKQKRPAHFIRLLIGAAAALTGIMAALNMQPVIAAASAITLAAAYIADAGYRQTKTEINWYKH